MASIIKEVFNFFAEPIRKYVVDHLCYIVQAGDNVKDLRREAEILEEKRKDVEMKIQRDDAALKKPTNEVDCWLKRTKKLQPTAISKEIEDDYKSRSCLLGSCSLNCFSNHSIGMQAVKELNNVRRELAFIEGPGVKEYTIETAVPAVQAKSTTITGEFRGDVFNSNLYQALEFLGGGDIITEEGPLGICGMGGVGKTTLLEHINNAILEKSPLSFGFDKVVFVTASRDCKDGNMLLKLIVKAMRLPESSDKDDVLNYLNNKSFVVLVDDLWGYVDLREAGIPLPLGVTADNTNKCKHKLILTSRFSNVCHDMGATQVINIECLTSEDARRLFRAHAGLKVDSMSSSELWELANAAADECSGLPIALVAIGRAMRGTQNVRVWSHALDLLRESKLSLIPGMNDPLPLLKFSYDHLAEREKECLLHCALWPEDYMFDPRELISCWLGHGLLGEHNTLQKAYDAGHVVIDRLQKACLLEGKQFSGAPQLGYEHVKLHDVIRDMALWIARECGDNEKKWVVISRTNIMAAMPQDQNAWREVHKMSIFPDISLGEDDDFDFSLHMHDCPNITTLILSSNALELSILQHMHGLKYLDLSPSLLRQGFPIEICGMEKLEYLSIRRSNINLFPKEVKNLTNLKFLLCRQCPISSLPDDFFPSLANLFELDLFSYTQSTSQSSIIDQLVSLKGSRLKSLGINASSIMDLQNLTRLSTKYGVSIRALHIGGTKDVISNNSLHLLSAESFGSQAMFSNMEDLVISDQHLKRIVIEDKYRLCNLESFFIQGFRLKNIIWEGVEPTAVFPRLRMIAIRGCGLRDVTWAASLPCLEYLGLDKCKYMKVLWDGNKCNEEEKNSRVLFPSLKAISLRDMPKLRRFSVGELSLHSLESLSVLDCPKLESLPFNSIESCNRLRHIVGKEEWWAALQLKENMRTFLEPIFHDLN